MRNLLLNITVACVAMSLAFAYSAFYCGNSGEPDLAEGLFLTFSIPFAIGAFIALCGYAATPVERDDRRQRSTRRG